MARHKGRPQPGRPSHPRLMSGRGFWFLLALLIQAGVAVLSAQSQEISAEPGSSIESTSLVQDTPNLEPAPPEEPDASTISGEPLPGVPSPGTLPGLRELQARARENSPALARQWARVAEQEAAIQEARARRWPQLDSNLGAAYILNPPEGISIPPGAFGSVQNPGDTYPVPVPADRVVLVEDPENTYFQWTSTLNQALFTWGKISSGIEAAQSGLESRRWELESAQRDLDRNLGQAWFGLYYGARALVKLQDLENLLAEMLSDQEENYQAGTVNLQAVLEARSELARVRSRRTAAQEQWATALYSLEILSGVPLGLSQDDLATLAGLEIDPETALAEGTHSNTNPVDSHPQAAALEALARQAQAGVRYAEASQTLRPDIALRAQLEISGQRIPLLAANWSDTWDNRVSFSLGLQVTLFDAGAAAARLGQARARWDQARSGHAEARQGLEIRQRQLTESHRSRRADQEQRLAEESLARERHRNALVSFQNDLATRREERGARVLLYLAELESLLAEYALVQVLLEWEHFSGVWVLPENL